MYNYAELNDILNRSVDYLKKNADRLVLRPGELDNLKELQSRWAILYPIHLDKLNRTKKSTQEFQALAKEVNSAIRSMQQYLKIAYAGLLLDDDFIVLDIHIDKTSQKIGLPTATVSLSVNSQDYATLELEASFRKRPEFNHGTVLNGRERKKIQLFSYIQKAEMPEPTEADFRWKETHGSSVFKTRFAPEDIGNKVYLKARFLNTTDGEGPFGEVLIFTVPD